MVPAITVEDLDDLAQAALTKSEQQQASALIRKPDEIMASWTDARYFDGVPK